MPHYFLDLMDNKTVHDFKGKQLANIQLARQHVIGIARELIKTKSTLLSEPISAWSVTVEPTETWVRLVGIISFGNAQASPASTGLLIAASVRAGRTAGRPSARLRRPSCPANGSMNAPALQTMNSRGVQNLLGSAPRKNRKAARALVVAALARSGLPPPCGL